MKNIATLLIVTIFIYSLYIINHIQAYATTASLSATAVPSPSASTSAEQKNSDLINNLKDRIASRVAQLKLVERRGVIGKVTAVTDTQITLEDVRNNTRFVDVDELTRFSSPSAKGSFGISDIKKGTTLGILGLYNKQSKRILARFVNVLILPVHIHGVVTKIDKQNFITQIATEGAQQIFIDIETSTRTSSYTKADGLKRAGFSKVTKGERITVIGFPDSKKPDHVIATRIILFSELLPNPKINVPSESATPTVTLQETITPSTGSGKKVTPIKQ